MIRLEHVQVVKQTTLILKDINLMIRQGDKILLKGESGSGKSTLVKSMLVFEHFQGKLFFNDEMITRNNLNNYRRQSGYISQSLPNFDENVRDFMGIPYNFKSNKMINIDGEKMSLLLERLNFSREVLNKSFSELSGGEKQRMVILQMMLLDKPLYFLDEVTSALDKKNIEAVISLITEDREKTIISISHNEEWEDYCTRVIHLDKGTVVKDYNLREN